MRLAFSKSFVQPPCKSVTPDTQARKNALMQELVRGAGISPEVAQTQEDGTLHFCGVSTPSLHTLTLEAEKLGLMVRYTKQTIVEIC